MKINQSWFQRTWVEQFHFLRLLLYFFGDFFTYRVMRRLLWQCWSCCYWWGHYWCSRSAWNCFEIWARLTNTWWTVWIDNSMLCIWHNWASWLWTEKRKHLFSICVWNKACMRKRVLYFRYKNISDFKKIFFIFKKLTQHWTYSHSIDSDDADWIPEMVFALVVVVWSGEWHVARQCLLSCFS